MSSHPFPALIGKSREPCPGPEPWGTPGVATVTARKGQTRVPTARGATPALRLGASLRTRLGAAPPRAGRVHSVFERAVNVEWHDGGLVTFHGPGRLLAPFAVTLPAMPRAAAIHPGLVAWRDAHGLSLGATRIRWEDAETVNLALGPAPEPPGAAIIATRAAAGAGGSLALASQAGRRGQDALARGMRDADAGAFIEGARALIGLGEGLTPAGDDCIVGALAVLRRLGRAHEHAVAAARDAIAEAAEHGTTTVGRAFLLHALDGEFSEIIADLLSAESLTEATGAAFRLRAIGGTSGADTLTGMRLAFEALGLIDT